MTTSYKPNELRGIWIVEMIKNNYMKKFALFLLLFCAACTETETKSADVIAEIPNEGNEIVMLPFHKMLDSAGLDGSILIFTKGNLFSNDFEWAKTGHLPASTYKIPNSIIALELGIMENDSTMIYWNGEPRYMKSWEQDLFFRDAFHLSCVPCYQEIARKIGVESMKQFTKDFNYGKMVFDSTTVDEFWLGGESVISQVEQIDFLQRFMEGALPISKRTQALMQQMMIIEETNDYTFRGKTGWSIQNEVNNCWFVGVVESNGETHYFATNIEPKEGTDVSVALSARKEITRQALQQMGILP